MYVMAKVPPPHTSFMISAGPDTPGTGKAGESYQPNVRAAKAIGCEQEIAADNLLRVHQSVILFTTEYYACKYIVIHRIGRNATRSATRLSTDFLFSINANPSL